MADDRQETHHDLLGEVLQNVLQRHRGVALLLFCQFLRGYVFRCFLQATANVERHEEQNGGNEEGSAPTPAEQLFFAQSADDEERGSCQGNAGRRSGQDNAREQPAPAHRHVFGHERYGTGQFGTGAEALYKAQEDQQDRGEHPNLCGGGQQAHADSRAGHEHDREDHCGLAAARIAQVPDDDSAQGAGEEAHAKGCQGGEGFCAAGI